MQRVLHIYMQVQVNGKIIFIANHKKISIEYKWVYSNNEWSAMFLIVLLQIYSNEVANISKFLSGPNMFCVIHLYVTICYIQFVQGVEFAVDLTHLEWV